MFDSHSTLAKCLSIFSLNFNHLLEYSIGKRPALYPGDGKEIPIGVRDMACVQAVSLVFTAFRSVPFVELKQTLPSRIPCISPFVEQLMCFIARFRNSDGTELDVEMALREALANAIVHGNREDSRRCVYVNCRCTIDGEVSITVKDEGPGFEPDAVVDPTTTENRLLAQGRGIYLMKTLMDEVRFEQRGAVVYMRKASNEGAGLKKR